MLDALTSLSGVGWPGAIVAVVLFAAIAIIMLARRRAERKAEAAAKRATYRAAVEAHVAMCQQGADPQLIAAKARDIDEMRRRGWHLLAVALCVALCGCGSPRAVEIPVGSYAAVVEAGDTVPPLPAGESRWWLMSAPTGIRLMMPHDSPVALEADDVK
jgi:hypothetical protein